MPVSVLIVDDSSFFCRTVGALVSKQPEFKVVGVANNGKEAIEKVLKLNPDIVTMDVEMPVMDGITALKEIMRVHPTAVVMFSSLTYEGAKMTVDALNAGAVDFVLKTYSDVSPNHPQAGKQLLEKLHEVAKAKVRNITKVLKSNESTVLQAARQIPSNIRSKRVKHPISLVAIGASTGGPIAIQNILLKLPQNFRLPVLVTLHMPANFTAAYASRLNSQSAVQVKEAATGDVLRPGVVYVAPGGHQMILSGHSGNASLRILDADPRVSYQPCVDVTFASAAKIFGSGVLAIVMTGMGADGREGAKLIKKQSGSVWSQDEGSCVVYGMPAAVTRAGLADEEVALDNIASRLLAEIM